MEFYKCDICYKTIHKSNKIQGLKDFGGIEKVEIDLCDKCYEDLNNYLLKCAEERNILKPKTDGDNIQMCQEVLLKSKMYFEHKDSDGCYVYTCPIKFTGQAFHKENVPKSSEDILKIMCGNCFANR